MKLFILSVLLLVGSAGSIARAEGLDIPSSGCYPVYDQDGFQWRMYYEKKNTGYYWVVSASGSYDCRPNTFANGTVMTEAELYKRLVESGAIRP